MASISGFIDRNHIRLLTSSSTGGNTRLLYRSHTSILEQKKKKKLSKRVYIYVFIFSSGRPSGELARQVPLFQKVVQPRIAGNNNNFMCIQQHIDPLYNSFFFSCVNYMCTNIFLKNYLNQIIKLNLKKK